MTGRRPIVLVVEDDPASAAVLEGLLQPQGYDIRVARSAAEAMAAIDGGLLPDVVISDVTMPGMPGFEFCRWVRSDAERRHVPFLFVTGRTDRESKIAALEAGADDLLTKPIDDVELLVRVDSMWRMSRSRAVLEERERTEQILRDIGEGVVVLDNEGSVVRSNEAAHRLLNLPDSFDPEFSFPAHVAAHFRDIRGSSRPSRRHLARIDRGVAGDLVLGWLESPVINRSGAPEGSIVTVRDVTAEFRREQATTLLLNAVNHKLRTPMTGILVGAELLEGSGGLDEESAQLLEIISQSADRLSAAIDQIGQAADQISTPVPTVPMTVEPGTEEAIVASLCAELGELAVQSRLERPVVVEGGAARIALREFVTNARQAGAASIDVHLVPNDGGLTFLVEDDGPGFPPEAEERVFEAFYQADRTGEKPGMGVGLALARDAATQAGGWVDARSRNGERTQFRLWLPGIEDPGDIVTAPQAS